MILRKQSSEEIHQPKALRLRCPACGREVLLISPFEGTNTANADISFTDDDVGTVAIGQRICPNPGCQCYVMVVYTREAQSEILATYPPERIDFDASGLPDRVRSAFEEAISCHAEECYAASAMMVRKTLEELCRDRGAEGDNLHDRIAALGNRAVLPEGMLEALHDLRLLGNDAAHVESRDYESIGPKEVEVAIEVAREILKATYQMKSIMARLTELKGGGSKVSDDA